MIWVRVRRIRNKSTLMQIAELVQAAQGIRSTLQDNVNIVCSKFPACHFSLSMLVMIVWLSVGAAHLIPEAWLLQGYPYPFLAALIGASVLVITGPCSLGLAIPVPVMVGCSLGARHGVLVKGGDTTLRLGSRVDVVVFDKTGTLTRGCPVVTDVKLDTTKGDESWRFDVAVWELLLCVETPSQHPLASAIKNHAQTVLSISNPDSATQNGPILSQFSEHQGKGVRGLVDFGRNILLPGGLAPASQFHVVLGTHAWLIENNIHFKGDFAFNLDHVTSKWSKRGKSIMFLGILPLASNARGGVVGALAAADALRPESRSIVAELRARNIEVWMLTGDSTAAANECARHLGIDNVIPEVLPHQKADRVRWLQTRVHTLPSKASRHQKEQRYIVAMVGEGTNDALALNQADLGIALGGGHDLAINAADAILLRSKLTDILTLLSLSKTTVQTINQNLIGVAMYNLLVLPFAAGLTLPLTGFSIPMPVAGLLLVSSSVAILINSLRPIYQFRPPSVSVSSKFTPVQFTNPN
ncbi:hypothetical protein DSO57_1001886 [Entomophthora muscae]|uniref:Uncharacterized protein n=1 Tax=Entomophthora muscae TaxID=34485 RepID=A0ACC2TK78_9FUNG|nr:hypothetical protein DSO57_1001886 [Entomophthora muscae]